MLVNFGIYDTECIVDLRTPGIILAMADDFGSDATLTIEHPERVQGKKINMRPIEVADGYRLFSIFPYGASSRYQNIHVWTWHAHYYWTPPGRRSLEIRKAELCLARVQRSEYRLEICCWQHPTIQYVLDRTTTKSMEEYFKHLQDAAENVNKL